MSELNYEIKELKDVHNIIVLDMKEKKYNPITVFFSMITYRDYPDLIRNAIQCVGSGYNDAILSFSDDLMEIGETMDENNVEFELFDDVIQISKLDYYKILRDAARKILQIQINKSHPEKKWIKDMEISLGKLNKLIKKDV